MDHLINCGKYKQKEQQKKQFKLKKPRSVSRKRFLLVFAGMVLLTSLLTGCSHFLEKNILTAENNTANNDQTKVYSKTDFVMDTVLSETIYGTQDFTNEIKDQLSQLEKEQLSWRIDTSTVSVVNTQCEKGEAVLLKEPFLEWVESCLTLAKKSEGAFDPSIGNLTRLWNIEGDNPSVPEVYNIEETLSRCGYKKLTLKKDKLSMKKGATLDLGAAGKGIACDEVEKYLETEESVKGAVIAVGGSILVYGSKPDDSSWNVAVQDPRGEDGDAMGVLTLSGTKYISTSGDYEKYFMENGKRYHHILDPHTGYPARSGLISVTIVCDNGLLSDGLSTACFVLGEEKGKELLEEYGAEGVFIDEDYNVSVTNGLKDSFEILRDEYKQTF